MYQRADGRWVAQVEAGLDRDGRRRRPRAVRRTKREALAALDELRRQVDQGVTPERTQSVGEFLEWWLATVVPDTVKPSTADAYADIVRLYITPHIGRVKLAKLSPQHVKSMLRAMETDGLSPRTRQYARAVLRRALRWAEQHGLVIRNVAALVDGPRKTGTKLDDTLDAAGTHAVIDAAAGDRLEALAVVVLRLGLRKGEALALSWDDIDLDAVTLTVRGTLKRRKGEGLYVDTTKTDAGVRELPLVAGTAEALPRAPSPPGRGAARPRAAVDRHGPRVHDGDRYAAGPAEREPLVVGAVRARRGRSSPVPRRPPHRRHAPARAGRPARGRVRRARARRARHHRGRLRKGGHGREAPGAGHPRRQGVTQFTVGRLCGSAGHLAARKDTSRTNPVCEVT